MWCNCKKLKKLIKEKDAQLIFLADKYVDLLNQLLCGKNEIVEWDNVKTFSLRLKKIK
tara:strand:- start:452 stop:625 length:174 start_codon:yes stop_codon:yes gene_type:complete